MQIGGAKTEQEFYEMYPTEEDFLMKHGGAINKLMAKGGEAYPQTATMDNFFSYGVPVPPTYYRKGGAFPMAQPENQFFSPFYGNVPNPYNKAMGGSSEAYPQAMSFPYGDTGRSTHFMMQDGGYMQEEPLPEMGVKGKTSAFLNRIKDTAASKVNSNLMMTGRPMNPEQYEFEEQFKSGGSLKKYQSKYTMGDVKSGPLFERRNLPMPDINSDRGTTNNYYYGPGPQGPQNAYSDQQLSPEYYNDIDYLYRGRMRPRSDFNIRGRGDFGNYSSTGWLKDEYGLEGLRNMNMTRMDESNPKWFQFLKRPTKTYYFGNQGEGSGYTPGQVDAQGMPINQQNMMVNQSNNENDSQYPNNMSWLARQFYQKGNKTAPQQRNVVPNQTYPDDPLSPRLESQYDPTGYNPEYSEARNQIFQNRGRRMGNELDALYQKQADMKELYDTDLSKKDMRKMNRLDNRLAKLGSRSGYSFYEEPTKPYVAKEPEIPSNRRPVPEPLKMFGASKFLTPDLQLKMKELKTPLSPILSDKRTEMDFDRNNPEHLRAMGKGIIEGATPDGFDDMLPKQRSGGSYNTGDVVDMTPEEIQKFIQMGGQVEFLD